MLLLPLRVAIIAQTVAAQAAAHQAQQDAIHGIVRPPPPPRTPEQIKADKRLDREGNIIMAIWLIIGGVIFCAPFFALAYACWKLIDIKLGTGGH